MLNPSTADQSVDDQTIRKCMGFARRLGYGSIDIVNLFAFRTRWPSELKDAGFPVGSENDNHIRAVAAESGGKIVCAWGSNAKGLKRVDDVFDLLKANSAQPFALRINAGGVPAHPVMLPYACTQIPLRTTR